MNTSLLISVNEHQLAELISDAVASALRSADYPPDSDARDDRANDILTRQELLDELKISPSTLASWQKQGYVTPRRIGRRVFFRREDLDHILNEQTSEWRVDQ